MSTFKQYLIEGDVIKNSKNGMPRQTIFITFAKRHRKIEPMR